MDGLTKLCKTCLVERPLNQFRKMAGCKDGVRPQCKTCRRVKDKEYRLANAEMYKKRSKERYAREKREGVAKKYTFRRLYGIEIEDYNRMFTDQRGCCQICRRHQSEFKKALAVDHCHTTGKVRGLLCSPCNRAIGQLRENIDSLKSAIEYLSR